MGLPGDLTKSQCLRRLQEARKKVVRVFSLHPHGTFTPGQQKKLMRMMDDLYDLIAAIKRK